MTEEELAEWLGLARVTPEVRDKIMASITPEQRTLYEHMRQVETDLILWQNGVGPKPAGVIVCADHHRHRRGGSQT
jgi:hypothetical protein